MIEQETVAELTPSKGLSTSGERRAAPDFQLLFESAPGLLLVLEPDAPRYTIVAVSDAYARATMRTREEILGRGLFEVWPADPASPETTGVSQTAASLERVLGGRATDVMALQRHDLHRPDGGARVVRYWSVLNAPVLGRDGRLLYIIHAVEDVTGRIEAARAGLAAQDWSAELRLHVARTESDIVERGQRLAALKEGLARAEEELSILHERAMQLDALRARYSPEVGLEALRLSEARLSGIVDGSPDAIVSVEEGRITRFNDSAESMFGYHRDEVLGAPLDVLLPERFRAKHHQHLEAFGAGAQNGRRLSPRRATIFGRRKNGEEFPIDASLSKLEILGTVVLTVTARDVSERSRHEDEQRRLAEAGRILMAAGSDQTRLLSEIADLCVVDLADWCSVNLALDGDIGRVRVVHADPAKAATCAALERHVLDPPAENAISEALNTQRAVLVSEIPQGYLEKIAQDAEHLALMRALETTSFIVVPLVARGQALGTLAVGSSRPTRRFGLRDVAEVERLASLVALALDNARLHAALERAVGVREEVLGIVAHDLRNPLNSIVLQARMLRSRTVDPDVREPDPPELIHRAAMRMNRLIQDLLDVSRLEAGRPLSMDPERVDTASLLTEAITQQQASTTASGRTLCVDVAAAPPFVWADRERLLQVLDNLLSNAVKFARERVTLGASTCEGETLFWVRDDGAGISEEHRAHLFDRFWQANKGDRRGAGLGLSIVKGIVDAHRGRVWVESETDVGTTFYIALPT